MSSEVLGIKNWQRQIVKLGEVATFINGFAFKPSDWDTKGLPIIRIQNLTGSSKEVNYYNKNYDSRYEINKGDVLISWSASLGVYIWNNGKAILNQHIFKVVFDKMDIDSNFFKYLISLKINEMIKYTHGSTMKHITKKYFDDINVTIPPLEVQKKIADILDKASELIEKRKLQIAKLDELTKSIFIDMFGDPVTNPKGWEVDKLGNIGELNRGMSKHRPRNDPKLLGGKYPLIQTGEVANANLYLNDYKQTYSELGLKQSKLWLKGTLCITIAANIAKTAILNIDACFPDSIVGFEPKVNANTIFVNFWFSFFQKILEEQAPESAQKNINLKILKELDTIVPPLELQNEFANIVEKIEEQKALLNQGLEKLELNYKSLMQQLFN